LAAGSQFGYSLLIVILFSNILAIILQNLAIKLGCVTGLDLAQANRKYFSKPVNLVFYVLCEIAIMVFISLFI
jgi:manganese transport protein